MTVQPRTALTERIGIPEPFAMVWISQALIRGLGRDRVFAVVRLKD